MDDAAKLTMLKHDLQLTTTAHDTYLGQLLNVAAKSMEREGIEFAVSPATDDIDLETAQVSYAAYLFRSRDNDTGMPRHLRYALNNILMSQKGTVEEEDEEDEDE